MMCLALVPKDCPTWGWEFFGWGDSSTHCRAHDVIDHPGPTPRSSLHALPSATGQLSGISPLRLGWTSFSLVTQGAVCIPLLMPWNKTLSLLSCHRSVGSLRSPSACSAALRAALALSLHPNNELICTLQLLGPSFDGQQHSAFSVSSPLPGCSSRDMGGWGLHTPAGDLRGHFRSKEPRTLPAPHTGGELGIDGHHLHVAEAPAAPPSKAKGEDTLTFPYQQDGPR